MLENENIPGQEGLDAARWREINRDSIAAWVDVPTAAIGMLLEAEAVLAGQASDTDGINTIGFSSNEGFVDGWFSGFARSVWENGQRIGCDIEISPYYFERSPVDEPEQERRRVPDLYGIMTHEMGHCLGLAHTAMNPMWLGRPGPPEWEPGILPEGIATLQPHPIMSYGSSFRSPDLTPDDIHAITLAYPAPGFSQSRGSIGGRVVFPDGDPVPLAYVQTVDYSGSTAAFGPGAFTDRRGQFMLEGMRPGPIHVWVRPLIASRAHGALELAQEAGSLDLVDRQRGSGCAPGRPRWFPTSWSSTAGVTTVSRFGRWAAGLSSWLAGCNTSDLPSAPVSPPPPAPEPLPEEIQLVPLGFRRPAVSAGRPSAVSSRGSGSLSR